MHNFARFLEESCDIGIAQISIHISQMRRSEVQKS